MSFKEIVDRSIFIAKVTPHTEDYAYFWQVLRKTKGEMLTEMLVNIEYLHNNISAKNYKKQLNSRMRIVVFLGTHKLSQLSVFLLVYTFLILKRIIERVKLIAYAH